MTLLNVKAQDMIKSFSFDLSMEEAINMAHLNSIAAQQHANSYTSSYWRFRSHKASLLPSLNLNSDIGNFNHSITQLQDATTGEILYNSNYYLSNNLQLSIDQVIPQTGGQISLYSNIERLDQYGDYSSTDYYNQPISLSYIQPIFSFNSYKWDKLIEPKNYERAKRSYLEDMENVTQNAVAYYFSYATAQNNYSIAQDNFKQSKELYLTSKESFKLGSITKTSLLQLELKVLNDSLEVNSKEVTLIDSRNRLSSYLGILPQTTLDAKVEYALPNLMLNFDKVLEKALSNSSFEIDHQIQRLESERQIAEYKGDRGIKVQFNARFGLSNSSSRFLHSYQNLGDQEVIGLSLSVPIYDWGLGKGKVQMAKSEAKTISDQLEQEMVDFYQDIMLKVMQFNNQIGQCNIAKRAVEVAEQSYDSARVSFVSGTMNVTDLNAAQSEYDNARISYMSAIANYWQYYYEIRSISLYDYLLEVDISTEFDKIIQSQH